MKRPNIANNLQRKKLMKFFGTTTNTGQLVDYPTPAPQTAVYSGNVTIPGAAVQSQLAAYFMPSNPYYPAMLAPNLASSIYSHLGLNAWQMAQAATPAVFDTPPPLPTTPAPENPPLPPLPPQEQEDPLSAKSQYYRGTDAQVASQSGLVVKSLASLHGQVLSPTLCESAKENRTSEQVRRYKVVRKQKKKSPTLHDKKRRKPMSESLRILRWNQDDAQRVLDLEKEYHGNKGSKAIVIRFPDPKLNYEIVKGFSTYIETVQFPQPTAQRSCIVYLKEGVDVKGVVEQLNRTPFGQGFLSAEPKRDENVNEELDVEDIDPYTLYIGNFPSDVNVEEVKAMFHTAKKIVFGYAQKMKVTRYGFARYTNVDDAIRAFKQNYNALYKSRTLIVRFRRTNRSIVLKEDCKRRKKEAHKPVQEMIEKSPNKEPSTPNDNVNYRNESDEEDTKSGVFDLASKLMENWVSDKSDDNLDASLPNLTGMIKHEPDDDSSNNYSGNEDGDIGPTDTDSQGVDKERLNTSLPRKLLANHRRIDGTSSHRIERGNNEKGISKRQKSAQFRESDYWEAIRQKELREKENKPDIRSLQPSSSPGTNPLITTYGLVPMLLPKQEPAEEESEEDRASEDYEGLVDFGNSFEQDDDNIDAAFERAWNELEVGET